MADEHDNDWITSELRRTAVEERAPAHLRMAVDQLSAQAARGRTASSGRRRRLALIPGAGVLAAIIVALLLILPSGTPGGPTVAQAAALGARAVTHLSATSVEGRITIRTDGAQFPDWQEYGWRKVGESVDTLDGHKMLTVEYAHGSQRVAYSIAVAPTLRGQKAGFTSFPLGERTVVSWTEAGQSCLLSSTDAPRSTLLKLAQS